MATEATVLARLPVWLSHWLGYRAEPRTKTPRHIAWLWSFIGAFGGLSILQAVFGHAHYFIERNVPSIIASYGASAVLVYGAIEAPLAQPRALVGGHLIASIIGVSLAKLFKLSANFESLRWLAGSLSTSITIVLMQMTATTHPPAGATALLAIVNDDVLELGWYLIAVTLLSSFLVLAVALLTNNIQRRYPAFWWEPNPLATSQTTSKASTLDSTSTRRCTPSAAAVDLEKLEAAEEERERESERL